MTMKFKTTQKAIKQNFTHIICVGYCNLQWLLSSIDPIAYTVRREGWGCDIYDLGCGVAVTTGYAPFGNIRPTYNMCQKYEQQARAIRASAITYADINDRLDALRKQFVQEVLQND